MRALYEAFHNIHPAMFGQVIVMRMFREKNILTQICGNNFMVLKAAPPLVVSEEPTGRICRGDSRRRGICGYFRCVLDGSAEFGAPRGKYLTIR